MYNGISLLAKEMIKMSKKIKYDIFILTRFDIFPTIKSFGKCLDSKNDNDIFIWRTIPYHNGIDAEDRIIITNINGLTALSEIYNSITSSGTAYIYGQAKYSHETYTKCTELLKKYNITYNNMVKLIQY